MLQSLRDRAQGWFATIVFAILIVPFALWGINWYVRERSEIVVAKVDGKRIKLPEYERTYQEQRRYLQTLYPDIGKLDQQTLKHQSLEKLINDQLLRNTVEDQRLRVGDQDLARAIQVFEAFKRDGKFATDLYDRRVRELGLSPAGFEERMRKDLATEQLHQGISDTNFVTQAAVDSLERLKGQRRDVVYATIAAEPLQAQIQPGDADIEGYYQRNSDRFMVPEQVRIAYLELSSEELATTVQVDEPKLREYYDTHIATYTTPEERSANHILVHAKKDAKPEEVEAARKLAETYLNEAKSGKSFEDIAMEKSDDVGSKGEGGKTGFFRRGVMAPEFEDAAFSMQPGELRGPIRTDFGWHIIRLNEVKPETTRSFEEARVDVETAYRKEQAERLFFEQADRLSTLTYENSDSLEPAAKALGLTIKESDFFPRSGGKDLLANPKVLEAAFGSEVLNERLNSQPVEITPTHTVVLRLIEHRPASLRPLAEVRDEVVKLATAELAGQRAEERGKALLERLHNGESLEAMARAEQLSLTEVKSVTRDDTKISRAVARTAFRLVPANAGAIAYGRVSVGTGDYLIVAVSALTDPDLSKADEAKVKQSRDELFATYANNDWRDYLAALQAKAKIKTYPDVL